MINKMTTTLLLPMFFTPITGVARKKTILTDKACSAVTCNGDSRLIVKK
jgi:hypothetical protein